MANMLQITKLGQFSFAWNNYEENFNSNITAILRALLMINGQMLVLCDITTGYKVVLQDPVWKI